MTFYNRWWHFTSYLLIDKKYLGDGQFPLYLLNFCNVVICTSLLSWQTKQKKFENHKGEFWRNALFIIIIQSKSHTLIQRKRGMTPYALIVTTLGALKILGIHKKCDLRYSSFKQLIVVLCVYTSYIFIKWLAVWIKFITCRQKKTFQMIQLF